MAKTKAGQISAVVSEDLKWRAESDLNTLMHACEIKKDAKRYKAAQELAKSRLDDLGEFVTRKDK